MSEQVSRLLRVSSYEGTTTAVFWCPGCDGPHAVRIAGPGSWDYNGDHEAPTFTPSVKVTRPPTPYCCHSFVRDGQIQFLSDCTHTLAGQTVPLGEWPEHYT